MDWEEIIKFLGSITGISAFLIFSSKKAIKAFINAKIENYKSNLEKITIEHSIRFQKLYTERAEAIKELYKKLVDLDLSLHSTLKAFHHISEPDLEEKVKTLSHKHNNLYFFYLPRKIFFEKDVCSLMDTIIEISRDVFIDITTYPIDPNDIEYKVDKDLLQERHKYWEKARKLHQNEITQLKEKLEDKFRTILGINS